MWQPAWGVRTILEALISFMTAPADGAVGALEFSPEERRRLARASTDYHHELMPSLPELSSDSNSTSGKFKEEAAKLYSMAAQVKVEEAAEERNATGETEQEQPRSGEASDNQVAATVARSADTVDHSSSTANLDGSNTVERSDQPEQELRRRVDASGRTGGVYSENVNSASRDDINPSRIQRSRQSTRADRLLYYALFIGMVVAAILYRKMLRWFREQI